MNIAHLTPEKLHETAEMLAKAIELQRQIAAALNGEEQNQYKTTQKRTMSAEGRAKIAAAVRKRWRKWKKAQK